MKPKVYKYANGGLVKGASKGPKKSTRDTMMSPKPASTADTLMNQRARQMKAMGLRDGGPVRKLPPAPQLPPPQRGEKPKKIVATGEAEKRRPKARPYRDGGKVKC